MKSILIIVASLFITVVNLLGQEIPNYDMENWVNTETPERPAGWLTNANFVTTQCTPAVCTALKTNDANNGSWAAELRAMECTDDFFQQQIFMVFLTCGSNIDYPNLVSGIAFNQRPSEMNFYYKFLSVNSDIGYAKVVLIDTASDGSMNQIIGEGSVDIIYDISTYTLMTIPINYYSSDTPDMIQIYFSTSKIVFLNNDLNAIPGSGANVGTTLWIDDISLTGGTMGTRKFVDSELIRIFPNPADETFFIEISNKYKSNKSICRIENIGGQLIKTVNLQDANIIDIKNLCNGLYILKIEFDNDIVVRKLIVE